MKIKKDQRGTVAAKSPIAPWRKRLYVKDDFWSKSSGLHHAYTVYRTLRGDYRHVFCPDKVFYVGRSPAAYLKTVSDFSEQELRAWQRFLWNQAVVPWLIVRSETKLRVYSADATPLQDGSEENIKSILEVVGDALELDKLLAEIETGTIYRQESVKSDRSKSVDKYLLRNLQATAGRIAETQHEGSNKTNLAFAHNLLTRLLFACYLVERGMIKGEHFPDSPLRKLRAKSGDAEYTLRHLFADLKTFTEKKNALCELFDRIKERFNGSLFYQDTSKEKKRFNQTLIAIIEDFLSGHDIHNGQLSLGFWAYDFSVIPIETISAVYEAFLGAQGEIALTEDGIDSRRSAGAYYTPPHLAELTVDIALEDVSKPYHEIKALDPACGSGIFLVTLFGRMAESLRRKRGYKGKRGSMAWGHQILPLAKQLYGIDVNQTACHITCFSLYLALLDQLTPMDVEDLYKEGVKLPSLLADSPAASERTIYHGNFFDPKLALSEKPFDIVIGNPPWVSRGKQNDAHFLKWMKSNATVRGPGKQIAHGFMWKALANLTESGTATLLLPTAVLMNAQTMEFQKSWLRAATIDRVVNFSDLRHVLFSGAIHPCVGVKFNRKEPSPDSKFRYESPKVDIRSQQGGCIYIHDEDVKVLRQGKVLHFACEDRASELWKSHFWGSWRDQRLLDRLAGLPKLERYTGTARKPKRFIKGQGFIPFNPSPGSTTNSAKPKNPWWEGTEFFLAAPRFRDSLVVVEDNCEIIGERFTALYRSSHPKLFDGPKVLVTQGARNMKVAFCGFNMLFQDSIQTITATSENDAYLMRFLSAVIRSDIIKYYLFHISSNWGVEREKVHFEELLSSPFSLPEDREDFEDANGIARTVAKHIGEAEKKAKAGKWFGSEDEVHQLQQEVFEPLIREYYGIDEYEAILIDDTIKTIIPSIQPGRSTPPVPTLNMATDQDCVAYANTLCKMLSNLSRDGKRHYRAHVYLCDPYSIVQLDIADRADKATISSASTDFSNILKRIDRLLQKQSGHFTFCQNMIVFDRGSLYILKSAQYRYWMKSTALNDADEIFGAVMSSKGTY